MKSQESKLITPNSRCTYPSPSRISKEDKEEEVLKRFYEQILKTFGHLR